ncbi:MAG TPA: hypothetical protein VGB53_04665 [Rubricoccaceae bacterium]
MPDRSAPDRPPKLKWLAMGLNFVLPGAGLAYLGLWRGALLNLLVAVGLAALAATTLPPETLARVGAPLTYGIAGGSLGVAMAGYDRLFGSSAP